MIYTAYKIGLYDQVDKYQQEFKLQYDPSREEILGDVVFLWNNGLGPLKEEWGGNFVLSHGAGGVVTFSNEELELSFPFLLSTEREDKFVRVVFPRYRERPLAYNNAHILTPDGKKQVLELVENINFISFQVLRQRMMRELSKSLLRVAVKKAAEYQVSKQNKMLGTIVGGINFLTEKADTRNWQTIPHSIYYARVRLPEGEHFVTFQAFSRLSAGVTDEYRQCCLKLKKNQTVFQIVNSPVAMSS